MPATARFLWLDLETTGLRADDLPLAIGMLKFVGPDADPRSEMVTFERAIRWPEHRLRAALTSPKVREMHEKNGLVQRVIDAVGDLGCVETEAWRWVRRNFPGDDPIYLAGSSIHFDRRVLGNHFPGLAALLHYRMLDVSALRLAATAWGVPPPPKAEKAHTPISDLLLSVAEFRRLYDLWVV